MKANVQYNDYLGTTAADRCDMFVEQPGEMNGIIIDKFVLPLDANDYQFIGISVYTTIVEKASVDFFFRHKKTKDVVKIHKYEVLLQDILSLFKRFEFQIGYHLEDIDEDKVTEIEVEEDE